MRVSTDSADTERIIKEFPLWCGGLKIQSSSSGHCRGGGLIACLARWVEGSEVATAEVQVSAVAQIQSLARELPKSVGAALKKKER